MKTNLPVILLRGIVILPQAEIKLDITKDIEKKAIAMAEEYHDNHILLACQPNLEENPDIRDISKIGIIGFIKVKMEMPNNKIKVIIKGLNRTHIYDLVNHDGYHEAAVGPITQYDVDLKMEMAYVRKTFKELKKYTGLIPYLDNTVLNQIDGLTSAGKLTDIVALVMPLSLERKITYLETLNPIERIKMLLSDIRQEEEITRLEQKIDLELKHQLDEAQKKFVLTEKMRIIREELGDISTKDKDVENINKKMKKLKLPKAVKARLNEEIKRYEGLPSNSPETAVVRNYIDWLLNLPWQVITRDNDDLKRAKQILNSSHYGLEKIKTRIIEYLGVKKMTKNLRSPILCFVGPPGTGKTSLAKSIATSLNRKFVKIAVGAASDEAEIVGHRRTYVGASPGRIIQAMKKAKVSNPVFLIDEIDKMSKSYRGDPASSLLEVLDPEQNQFFADHYIEVEYDLSKVLFIATANYLHDIPEALRDRLEIVELSGYTEYEKLDIAKKHLLPKQLEEHGLDKVKITLDDEAILTIIRNYTKEAGVRELERLIATVLRKIVTKLVAKEPKSKLEFAIKNKDVTKYLGKEKYLPNDQDVGDKVGVVNGLAYTYFGGDILPIEVTFFKGKGDLVLTGSLGEVMKESARIALSYIKSHADELGIEAKKISQNDIHIHVPEGAIPKDGPSAGITLTTALISAFKNMPINHTIGMTGEMTLRGSVLRIGGLKEKAIGAHRNGLKIIIIPRGNERDLDEIPKEIREELSFISVKKYEEVLDIVNQ